ncbi:MAG: hypothetical protein GX442_24320 [Candidatus Riflebacteria bacterium]|nr:hypothetical protein [Candidatus Riflebacteria bacterium]
MRFVHAVAVLVVLAAAAMPLAATADVMRYVFPANLSLTITPIGSWSTDKGGALKAVIQSRVGTLRQVEIFFECSPDLTVHPTRSTVREIAENAVESVPVVVGKGPGRPDEMGSWVRMRVRYLPDFEAVAKRIGDPTSFPVAYERQRLIDINARNQKKAAPYTSATRFFIH